MISSSTPTVFRNSRQSSRRLEHRQIVRADEQQLAKSSFGDPVRLELQSHLTVERLEDDG